MPHHEWGDEDFDWISLDKAIHLIHWACTKIGRIGVHNKEKYGTHRMSTYLWDGSLHSLVYPGYVYSQFPKWLWSLDHILFQPLVRFIGLHKLFRVWQKLVLRSVFAYVLRKYPHINDELVSDIDCYLLIKGGKEIHDKYWV